MFIRSVYAADPLDVVTQDVVPLYALNTLFGNVVAVFLGFSGIGLFIMLLIGGFKWLTAGGDPKKIEEAKATITYALGGMILVAMALLILQLIKNITGADVMNFEIYHF